MDILILLLFSAALVDATDYTNFADTECGLSVVEPTSDVDVARSHRLSRIVGGTDATPGEFPWLVSLARSGGHFCGATIVNQRWVLTAAHCLCSGTDVLGTASMRVCPGRHDLRHDSATHLQVPVTALVLHPEFRCAHYDHDIALVRLGAAVSWSASVQPACFDRARAHTPVTAAGWGWTHENSTKGVRANVLQKVDLTLLQDEECTEWYLSQGKRLKLHESQMCAGVQQGGKDACWADSGGPLMDSGAVVGVVSTGVGCARPRLPGLYTRVANYLPWIAATVQDTG